MEEFANVIVPKSFVLVKSLFEIFIDYNKRDAYFIPSKGKNFHAFATYEYHI